MILMRGFFVTDMYSSQVKLMKQNPLAFWGWILETWINPFKHIGPAPARAPVRADQRAGVKSRRKPLLLSRASKCVWQLDREG